MKSFWESRLEASDAGHDKRERPVNGNSEVHEALATLVRALARSAVHVAQDPLSNFDANAGGP
jgi:hypothetical protein